MNKDIILLHLLHNLDRSLCFPSVLNAKLRESRTATQNRLSRLYYQGLVGRYKTRGNRSIYTLTEKGKEVLEHAKQEDEKE